MLSRLHLRPLPLALIALTSFLWLPSASAETAEAFRGKRSLNGTWEAVTAQETADQPPGTGWEPRPVPNTQQSDAAAARSGRGTGGSLRSRRNGRGGACS